MVVTSEEKSHKKKTAEGTTISKTIRVDIVLFSARLQEQRIYFSGKNNRFSLFNLYRYNLHTYPNVLTILLFTYQGYQILDNCVYPLLFEPFYVSNSFHFTKLYCQQDHFFPCKLTKIYF